MVKINIPKGFVKIRQKWKKEKLWSHDLHHCTEGYNSHKVYSNGPNKLRLMSNGEFMKIYWFHNKCWHYEPPHLDLQFANSTFNISGTWNVNTPQVQNTLLQILKTNLYDFIDCQTLKKYFLYCKDNVYFKSMTMLVNKTLKFQTYRAQNLCHFLPKNVRNFCSASYSHFIRKTVSKTDFMGIRFKEHLTNNYVELMMLWTTEPR